MEILITPSTAAVIAIVLGTYFMFQKVGEEGWKAIVPFYSEYTEYKIAWNTKMFWVQLLLNSVTFVAFITAYVALMMHLTFMGIALMIMIVFGIASLAMETQKSYKLSKRFGYGFGFSLGLVFLAPIFKLILGLDESKYIAA